MQGVMADGCSTCAPKEGLGTVEIGDGCRYRGGRGGVQHLRAEVGELDRLFTAGGVKRRRSRLASCEVGELHRLVILERVDREGLGHAARVRLGFEYRGGGVWVRVPCG